MSLVAPPPTSCRSQENQPYSHHPALPPRNTSVPPAAPHRPTDLHGREVPGDRPGEPVRLPLAWAQYA